MFTGEKYSFVIVLLSVCVCSNLSVDDLVINDPFEGDFKEPDTTTLASLFGMTLSDVRDLIVSLFFLRVKNPNMLVFLVIFSLDLVLLDEFVDLMLRSNSDLDRFFKFVCSSSISKMFVLDTFCTKLLLTFLLF